MEAKYLKPKHLLYTLILLVCLSFVANVTAQTGDGWGDDGTGWTDGEPTPTPTAAPTAAPTITAIVSAFNNVYAAILLLSIVGIVCVVSAVFIVVKGDGDMEEVGKVAVVLIIIGVGCIVAVVVTFAMQGAIHI